VFITGASRGIGRSIALRLAKDGANVAIAAKTSEPHPKLQGTIFTVAKEVEEVGGKALPLMTDIRFEDQVESAVKKTVETFGGIDILVNNASAIWLRGTAETSMKKFDLMMGINTRGTYCCSAACFPYLQESARKGRNPHILNMSPPLSMKPRWFKDHVAYTMAKYGMSMCVLGMSEEFREHEIAVNALWPRTAIATAAMEWIGGQESFDSCRIPEIMSDAAYYILKQNSREATGNFFLDDEVLVKYAGMTAKDIEKYSVKPGTQLMNDFFVDDDFGRNTITSKL